MVVEVVRVIQRQVSYGQIQRYDGQPIREIHNDRKVHRIVHIESRIDLPQERN